MAGTGARALLATADPGSRGLLPDLRQEGFQVLEASNGVDALSLMRRPGVDVALIELDLPEIDGLELVRRVRQESTVPILLLAGDDGEGARLEGIELGADDFITAPYSPGEIAVRVRAMMRRTRRFQAEQTVLRSGRVELDLSARRCLIGQREVQLTRREFDLLAALLRYEGRIHTREQLLCLVWDDDELAGKTVDVHVAALRRKLGSSITITTLRGAGYRLDPA